MKAPEFNTPQLQRAPSTLNMVRFPWTPEPTCKSLPDVADDILTVPWISNAVVGVVMLIPTLLVFVKRAPERFTAPLTSRSLDGVVELMPTLPVPSILILSTTVVVSPVWNEIMPLVEPLPPLAPVDCNHKT